MMDRMTDERLAEIERGIKENWCFDLVDLSLELLQAFKSERAEVMEQCRLNGMGAEREARLRGRIAELETEVERLRAELQKRIDAPADHLAAQKRAEAALERVRGLPDKWRAYEPHIDRPSTYDGFKVGAEHCANELRAALKPAAPQDGAQAVPFKAEASHLGLSFQNPGREIGYIERDGTITAPQDELARLEREIAEEAAISMIECAGLPVREGTEKCDPLWLDISDGECHPDDRYLELRGMLERHPDYPNWVRFVNS